LDGGFAADNEAKIVLNGQELKDTNGNLIVNDNWGGFTAFSLQSSPILKRGKNNLTLVTANWGGPGGARLAVDAFYTVPTFEIDFSDSPMTIQFADPTTKVALSRCVASEPLFVTFQTYNADTMVALGASSTVRVSSDGTAKYYFWSGGYILGMPTTNSGTFFVRATPSWMSGYVDSTPFTVNIA